MAFGNRDKKRVRIQSGHQERIIERRASRPKRRGRSARRSTRRSTRRSPKRRMRKMRSVVRRSQADTPHWYCKTHRPSVAQVVYQFLERASNGSSSKSQKSNASNQFRQLQRRKHSKRLQPNVPKRIRPKVEALDSSKSEYQFPYSQVPSQQAEQSIEKCIYEVLSFGTILGLLQPADKQGMTFRVSSDIALFKDEKKQEKSKESRKRKLKLLRHDEDDCIENDYCDY